MKSFYIIFTVAILVDLALLPPLAAIAWGPRFSIAVLPFLFLFSSRQVLTATAIAFSLFLWAANGVNLGVAAFAVGITIFFERWFLPRIFQSDSRQMIVASASAVLVLGVILAGLEAILLKNNGFVTVSFGLTLLVSAIFAVGINFFLRLTVYRNIHDTKIS